MENNDPWGLMRGRDKFVLREAAHIVSNVPTFRQHLFALGVETSTKDDRDDCARVLEAEWELKGAADALCDWVWRGREGDAPPLWAFSAFGCQEVADGEGKVTRYGPIQRAALEVWCDARGLRPDCFSVSSAADVGDASGVREMNSNRALAVMAWLLAKRAPEFRNGESPNKYQIGEAVVSAASAIFGDDSAGFKSFRKRLSEALKDYPDG